MSLKLPDGFLREFIRSQDRERTTLFQLGSLEQEYEVHRKRLLEHSKLEHDSQDALVAAGLRALSLDPENKEHHYFILSDGTVTEIIDGKQVPLPGDDKK